MAKVKTKNLAAIKKRQENKIKKLQASHSSYWIQDVSQYVTEPGEKITRDDKLVRLAAVRRAIGNFVKIGSGSDIPVMFSSGKMSYTDGKVVVISAADNPTKFDSQVGLALHEASHIKYSTESLHFLTRPESWFFGQYESMGLLERAKIVYQHDKNGWAIPLKNDVHFIMNILEDRRIDTLTYKFAPGYRPYYTSLYKEYFATRQNKTIAKSQEARMPTMQNYFFWIGMLPTELFDINALPGLDKIVQLMDLKHPERFGPADPNWQNVIRKYPSKAGDYMENINEKVILTEDSLPLLFLTAMQVVKQIYEFAINPPSRPSNQKQKEKKGDGAASLPNLDMGSGAGEGEGEPMTAEEAAEMLSKLTQGKVSAEDIKKALDQLQKTAQGDINKKSVSKKDAQRIDDLVEAQAEVKEAGKDLFGGNVRQMGKVGTATRNSRVPVVVYKEVNKGNVQKIPFGGFSKHSGSERAIADGFRMGNRLAHQIRVMNDDRSTKYIRQVEGRVDRRMLAGLGYEQENVFYRIVKENIRPVHVHLSIDASGSMSGIKWQNAMTLAVALAVAADKIRTMRVVIDVRAGLDYNAGVAIIYDSKKDRIRKLQDVVPYLNVCGSTPEGLAFEAIMDSILERTGDERKYFINLSDGQPAFSSGGWNSYNSLNYTGETAWIHTAKQVQMMRDAGVKVLSYFIEHHSSGWGDERSPFRRMYGQDASFIDPSSVPHITQTLNKLFLE